MTSYEHVAAALSAPAPVDRTAPETLRAAEQISEGTTRFRRRYLVGDDGSRSQVNWYDTQRGEPCRFRMAVDGRYRCLPELLRAALTDARPDGVTASMTVGYADDQCTRSRFARAASAMIQRSNTSGGSGTPATRLANPFSGRALDRDTRGCAALRRARRSQDRAARHGRNRGGVARNRG